MRDKNLKKKKKKKLAYNFKDYRFSQIEFQQTKKSKRTVLACGFFPASSLRRKKKKKKKKKKIGLQLLLSVPYVVVAIRASQQPILQKSLKCLKQNNDFLSITKILIILNTNTDFSLNDVEFESSISREILSMSPIAACKAAVKTEYMKNSSGRKDLAIINHLDYQIPLQLSSDGLKISLHEDVLVVGKPIKGNPILVSSNIAMPSFRSNRVTVPDASIAASKLLFSRHSSGKKYNKMMFFEIWQKIISFISKSNLISLIESAETNHQQLGLFFLYVGVSVSPSLVVSYPPPLLHLKHITDLSLISCVKFDLYSVTALIALRCRNKQLLQMVINNKNYCLLGMLVESFVNNSSENNSIMTRQFISKLLWKFRLDFCVSDLESLLSSVVKNDDLQLFKNIILIKSLSREFQSQLIDVISSALRNRSQRILQFLTNQILVYYLKTTSLAYAQLSADKHLRLRNFYENITTAPKPFMSKADKKRESSYYINNVFEDQFSDIENLLKKIIIVSIEFSNVDLFNKVMSACEISNINTDSNKLIESCHKYKSWSILGNLLISKDIKSLTISFLEDVLFDVIDRCYDISILKLIIKQSLKSDCVTYTLLKNCVFRAIAMGNWTAVILFLMNSSQTDLYSMLYSVLHHRIKQTDDDDDDDDDDDHSTCTSINREHNLQLSQIDFFKKCERLLHALDNGDKTITDVVDDKKDDSSHKYLSVKLPSTVIDNSQDNDGNWLLDEESSSVSEECDVLQNFLFTQIRGYNIINNCFNSDPSLINLLSLKSRMIVSVILDAFSTSSALTAALYNQKAAFCLCESLTTCYSRSSLPSWHRVYCLSLNRQHRYSSESLFGNQNPATVSVVTVKVIMEDVFYNVVARVYTRQYSSKQGRIINIPSQYCHIIILQETEEKLFTDGVSPREVLSDFIIQYAKKNNDFDVKLPYVPVYVFSVWEGSGAILRWIVVFDAKTKTVTSVGMVSLSRMLKSKLDLSDCIYPATRTLSSEDLLWKTLWDIPPSAWNPTIKSYPQSRSRHVDVGDEQQADEEDFPHRILVLKTPNNETSSSFNISLGMAIDVVSSWEGHFQ